MDGITVQGRMIRAPYVSVEAHEGHVAIMIADETNDGFWLNTQITGPALVEMLLQVLRVKGGPVQGYYIALEALQIALRR